MSKLSKTASHLDNFLKIGFWCILVFTGIALLISILALCVPVSEFDAFAPDLTLGNITFTVANNQVHPSAHKANILLITATGLLSCGYVVYTVHTLRRILAPMIDGEPFHKTVSIRLKRLSWVTLIGGGILSILNTVLDYILLNMYDLDALFLSKGIVDYTVKFNTDLSFIVAFLVLREII